ncbi:hypothetical protein [Bacillus kexueae]|nr:hypothetical protein [Bacillus kexueae]
MNQKRRPQSSIVIQNSSKQSLAQPQKRKKKGCGCGKKYVKNN